MIMTFDELKQAVADKDGSSITDETGKVLWLAGCGEWEQAHDIVESLPEPGASWIHAMLHREEGDLGNAGYWYYRAKQDMPVANVTIAQEWVQIAKALLG